MEEQKYQDRSYGQVSFSRIQSTGKELFGSVINHNSYISLKINSSEMVEDDLYQTHYFERDKLIEINLSTAQFAELITTLNYGSGTPCTIEFIKGEGRIPYKKPYDADILKTLETVVETEQKRVTGVVYDLQEELQEVLSKKSIGKKDKEELKLKISVLIQNCINSHSFAEQQFVKNMEKHVSDCKTEIDSTLAQRAKLLGEQIKEVE